MRASDLILTLLALCVAGCSYDYPMKAVFQDGELYIAAAEDDWYFGDTGFCPRQVSVTSTDGDVVWQIETEQFIHPCELFPLRLGSEPDQWRTVVELKPLIPGKTYVIAASGGDFYHGAFRYDEAKLRKVKNEPELAKGFPPYGDQTFEKSSQLD